MSSINLQMAEKPSGTYAAIIETFIDPVSRKRSSRTIKSFGNIKHLEKDHPDVKAFLRQERDRLRRDPEAVDSLRSEVNNRIFPVVPRQERESAYQAAPRLIYGDAAIRSVWEELDLPSWLNKIKYNSKLSYDLDLAVFYMTACRILAPSSRRKMMAVAPQYLFDYKGKLTLDNLYDALEQLAKKGRKDRLMGYLEKQTEKLVVRNTNLVFYDVTTFYFESFEPDELRARGMSKEHRTHETQVVLGLLIDRDGIPLSYELYRGNKPETHTLLPIVTAYKAAHPDGKAIVVADRGLNSRNNLAELKKAGCEYIVAQSLHRLTKEQQDELFNESGWRTVSADPETGEIASKLKSMPFSIEKEKKETEKDKDTKEEKEQDTEEEQEKSPDSRLIVSWSLRRYKNDTKQLLAQWEQAKKLHDGGSSAVNAAFKRGSRQFLKGGKDNKFELNEALYKKKEKFAGFYGLVTSCGEMSDSEIYSHLRELWRIEENFRVMKTVLQARPVFVRTESHIRGHFAVCVLALIIERLMHKRLKDADMDISFEYLRELLLAPAVSPIRTARNKEQMYLKTGLFMTRGPEHESPVLVDMVAEAEKAMSHFNLKPLQTLDSLRNIRRCLPVKLPLSG